MANPRQTPGEHYVVTLRMKSFYITTAIDYVNGSPHLGHAYEKVLTDVIARFRRQMGDRVHFLTGVDEHGQKVQASARQRGIPAQQFCDEVSAEFRGLLPRLNIAHDDFIRTTEERHKRVVRAVLQQLFDQGQIYRAEYQGFYSTRQEQFLQDKDRQPDGSWPEIFGEVTEITESNYFFKLKQHQEWLVDFLTKNPDFIFPRYRQTQVLEFLKEPLNDLCISRPRERLEWGIPLPFDEHYVTYVWFDALLNYYSAVADQPGVWPAAFHVIGKDILVPPHAVYWPIMLHAAGLPLPGGIIAHGWWLQRGAKMSKSTGNALNPLDLVGEFGTDAFRYFLLREIPFDGDGSFSWERFDAVYTSELANGLGNLASRTIAMVEKYCEGVVPSVDPTDTCLALDAAECADLAAAITTIDGSRGYLCHESLDTVARLTVRANGFIQQTQPWVIAKDPARKAELDAVLAALIRSLARQASWLAPFMPTKAQELWTQIGGAGSVHDTRFADLEQLSVAGWTVTKGTGMFPRPEPPKA